MKIPRRNQICSKDTALLPPSVRSWWNTVPWVLLQGQFSAEKETKQTGVWGWCSSHCIAAPGPIATRWARAPSGPMEIPFLVFDSQCDLETKNAWLSCTPGSLRGWALSPVSWAHGPLTRLLTSLVLDACIAFPIKSFLFMGQVQFLFLATQVFWHTFSMAPDGNTVSGIIHKEGCEVVHKERWHFSVMELLYCILGKIVNSTSTPQWYGYYCLEWGHNDLSQKVSHFKEKH